MKKEDLRVDQLVVVEFLYKDDKSSWRNTKKTGLVCYVTDESLSIKLPDGEIEDIKFIQEEYSVIFGQVSEFEYIKLIKKEIEDKKKTLKRYEEELVDIQDWLETYEKQISFIGKLIKFVKDYNK